MDLLSGSTDNDECFVVDGGKQLSDRAHLHETGRTTFRQVD